MGLGSSQSRRTIAVVALAVGLAVPAARAQRPLGFQLELSDAIQVDEADAATRTQLERVKAFVANQQWDEAVEVLWKLPELHGGRMLPVSSLRFVNVRDYCHLQLAALPAEALAIYRDRVDAQARRLYEEGMRRRDERSLLQVIHQYFCSSSGDDALLALGDLALEAGNTGQARGYWERILPADYWSRLAPGSPVWLLYPDTNLDQAAVRARLLLANILQGDREHARLGLETFRRQCGTANGNMGGRQVNYAEFLDELLSQSAQWPAEHADRLWLTFAGATERTKVYPQPLEAGPVAWKVDLPEISAIEASFTAGSRRVAESRDQLLSYHPVIFDNLVLVSTLDDVRAYDLESGRPVWVESDDQPYFYKLPGERGEHHDSGRTTVPSLGAPRFTLTVHNRRVYARLGSPLTSRPSDAPFQLKRSHLVCLDLDDEGSLIWNVSDALDGDVTDRSWAFEGSPVVDAGGVYVALRRSGVRPQQYIACLDPETGRLKWRRLICAADTPAQGQEEITHNLLTLHAGTLYACTNLGAVAAIDARDGEILWIRRYPRARQVDFSKRPKHFYRDLTPCVYDHGLVFAAPADSEWLMALDAPTGLLRWETQFADDVVHLLGVVDGKLVASGDKLWWIDILQQGKIVSPPGCGRAACFPEGGSPKGLGRGLLAGNRVYWPTWDKIYLFDQQANRRLDPIDLNVRGTSGGNLLPAGNSLLIATHNRLTLLKPTGRREQGTTESGKAKVESAKGKVERGDGSRQSGGLQSFQKVPTHTKELDGEF